MSKKQKLKQFKVLYFPDPKDPLLEKQEIISAYSESDTEMIFRVNHREELAGNETFFGWIEEIA